MTYREIKRAIYLTGYRGNYEVHHDIDGQQIVCFVPSAEIGNAIVRALRQLARKRRRT